MKKFLLYAILVGLITSVVAAWWHGSAYLFATGHTEDSIIGIGRLLGLFAAGMLPLQLILIGRVKWVETVFGLDKLSRLHRTNGLIILGLIIAHPLLMIWAYASITKIGLFSQYVNFLKDTDNTLLAFLGVAILLITIALSLTIVRRKLKYEWWYYVHIFNYLAISLIFFHVKEMTETSVYWEWPALWVGLYIFTALNVLWFRFTRPTLRTIAHQFRISRVVPEGVATSVYITGRNMDKFKVKAGQFMIFRFLQKGFWWQAHPFSASMVPKNDEIRLTAKRLGDFTNKMPELKPDTQVVIDGPHGIFTADVIHRNKLLFIAGGIGITPIRALLEELGPKGKDMVLLYANKTRSDIVLGQELSDLSAQYHFKIINILSDEQADGYEHGWLDQEKLASLVPDITGREVFLCGPPQMMLALRKALHNLGVPKLLVHFERFAL